MSRFTNMVSIVHNTAYHSHNPSSYKREFYLDPVIKIPDSVLALGNPAGNAVALTTPTLKLHTNASAELVIHIADINVEDPVHPLPEVVVDIAAKGDVSVDLVRDKQSSTLDLSHFYPSEICFTPLSRQS